MQCRNCGYSRETLSEFASCPECGFPDARWADVPRLKQRKRRIWILAWMACCLTPLILISCAAGVFALAFIRLGPLPLPDGMTAWFFGLCLVPPLVFARRLALVHRMIEPRELPTRTVLRGVLHAVTLACGSVGIATLVAWLPRLLGIR